MKRQQSTCHYFYQDNEVVTVYSQGLPRSIVRAMAVPLAERQPAKTLTADLLACDDNGSVMQVVNGGGSETLAYSVYGYSAQLKSSEVLIAFKGNRFDRILGAYPLGTGYHRSCSPTLGRFYTPDTLAPFDVDDINPYVAFMNNPTGYDDPSGHWSVPRFLLPKRYVVRRLFTKLTKSTKTLESVNDTKSILVSPSAQNKRLKGQLINRGNRASERIDQKLKALQEDKYSNAVRAYQDQLKNEKGAGDPFQAIMDRELKAQNKFKSIMIQRAENSRTFRPQGVKEENIFGMFMPEQRGNERSDETIRNIREGQ